MADVENDPLTGAFAEFRAQVAPYVRAAGVDQTRETLRSRKRNHAIALGVLAALVVAIPAAAYAAIGQDPHGSPPPQTADTPTSTSTSSPAPSATSPSPSTTTPSTPPSSSPSIASAGPISMPELKNATLDLPDWAPDARIKSCSTGPTKFIDGAHFIAGSIHVWVEKAVYVDIDHNGSKETIVRFSCGDQESTYQVVAFKRDAKGKVVTIGQVAQQTGGVTDICDIRAGSGGLVELRVFDYPMPLRCPENSTFDGRWVNKIWIGYSWNGSGFSLTSGPAEFPDNPYRSDLSVKTSSLTMSRGSGGTYSGTMTVTVRNEGEHAIPYTIDVGITQEMQLTAPRSGCSVERFPQAANTTCRGASLASGTTRTLTLKFTAAARVVPDFLPQVTVDAADGYADTKRSNDNADFEIKS